MLLSSTRPGRCQPREASGAARRHPPGSHSSGHACTGPLQRRLRSTSGLILREGPVADAGQTPHAAATPEHPSATLRLRPIAGGEKAKARDILAAIRTLKQVEQRAAARHPGGAAGPRPLRRLRPRRPVHLPRPGHRPLQGRSWQALGEELKALLTPEEYDSAKRTTFNAFYTSPTVIQRHARGPGPPRRARTTPLVLEPGCGTGRLPYLAPAGHALHRRRTGQHLRPHRPAAPPRADIRIENFRDTRLPELDAVIGNVPFADVKLDHHGQQFSLHDYFFAKSVDALKPGGVLALVTSPLHPRQAERRDPRVPRRPGRLPRGDPPALRRLQAGGHGRRHRHRVPAEAGAGRGRRTTPTPTG